MSKFSSIILNALDVVIGATLNCQLPLSGRHIAKNKLFMQPLSLQIVYNQPVNKKPTCFCNDIFAALSLTVLCICNLTLTTWVQPGYEAR